MSSEQREWKPARVGILLLDSELRLVHHNAEAASILNNQERSPQRPCIEPVLPAVRAQIDNPGRQDPAGEFVSGRRRYSCRAFQLDAKRNEGSRPGIVVLLERQRVVPSQVAHWADQFQLTTRERETVELLLQGFTSKEIADKMNISPHTVKTFLKLVMCKVGASNRTGIVAKLMAKVS